MSSRPTRDGGRPSPGCARSAAVDTLTALAVHLELGADWQRFEKPTPRRELARADPVTLSVRRVRPPRSDHEDRLAARPPTARRVRLALRPRTANRRDPGQPPERAARSHPADLQPRPAAPAPHLHLDEGARQASQRHDRRGRARAVLLPLGRRDRTLTPASPTNSSTPAQEAGTPGRHSGRHARHSYEQPPTRATLVPRPAHRRQQKQGHGVSRIPAFQTGNAVTEPDVPPS